jgi:hypothetical protein
MTTSIEECRMPAGGIAVPRRTGDLCKDNAVWVFRVICVSVIISLIFLGRLVLNLEPDGTEKFIVEQVALETYEKYSNRLDSLAHTQSE